MDPSRPFSRTEVAALLIYSSGVSRTNSLGTQAIYFGFASIDASPISLLRILEIRFEQLDEEQFCCTLTANQIKFSSQNVKIAAIMSLVKS
jgi:hypothetical protein